jgi:hypothetical protein
MENSFGFPSLPSPVNPILVYYITYTQVNIVNSDLGISTLRFTPDVEACM